MRIFSRIDIKNHNVIKGIQLEGLRVIGDPKVLVRKYSQEGSDEILLVDAVASYYDRNSLFSLIEIFSEKIFIPLTLSGGIRNFKDIEKALKSGADKVSINTQFIKNRKFIKKACEMFGSSTISTIVEAKKLDGKWFAYYDNGRENSGFLVDEWIEILQENGIGEIIVNSIDKDGTLAGPDDKLIRSICKKIKVPFVYSGGIKTKEHIKKIKKYFKEVDGIALSSALHYNHIRLSDIKK